MTSLSQIFALIGIVLMAVSLLLSTRIRIVEDIFGGLDKVYRVHHLIGVVAFIMLVNHPLLLVVQSLPDYKLALNYMIPGPDTSYNFGVFAQYFMILPFIFILLIKIPYNLWRYTHKLLGISFLFASLHAINISSDVSVYMPLRYWILFFIGIGLFSGIYTLIFYKNFGPRKIYVVKKTEQLLDIINIYLKPVGKKMNFISGQFAYFRFTKSKVSKEPHPFSFSGAPSEEDARISVKILGDYTMSAREISEGDVVAVYGPYGRFGEIYNDPVKKKLIWIAGGIGVTPFLSMLRQESVNSLGHEINFFYSFLKPEEAVFKDEIDKFSSGLSNVRIYYWCSSEKGKITAGKVAEITGEVTNAFVQVCGPEKMMVAMKEQFGELGLPEQHFFYEDFSMK
jgi:predicted ferric reductase